MRSVLLVWLLGGCLIVHTDDQIVDEPCPEQAPELLADATGPLALADAIYFVGRNGTLSRLAFDGGLVSELTTSTIGASLIAADTTDLYWSSAGAIMRKPLAGGGAYAIADGRFDVTALAVDATSVVWADSGGLVRWDKAGQTLEVLDPAVPILGLAALAGSFYYSDTRGGHVRKAPPATDLAAATAPGPLVAVDSAVYFYDVAEPFAARGGALRLVPRDGGDIVTTADQLPRVLALAVDDVSLYFSTVDDARYRIQQVSRFGGDVRTLACGQFVDQLIPVAVAGSFVYFGDGRGLYRIAKTTLTPD